MTDNTAPGPIRDGNGVREKVCIHTKKILDSCRDKDCIEDLRLYPTLCSQALINSAVAVGNGRAELLYVGVRVDPVAFNRGFYTVHMRYFYRVMVQVFTGAPNPMDADGICIFEKRVMLFGGKGHSKTFTSGVFDPMAGNRPDAVVEAVDPIVLDTRLATVTADDAVDAAACEIPDSVRSLFNTEIDTTCTGKRVYVTLGQFSVVRLERDAHLLIPVCDYCLPERECRCGGGGEDPCEMFSHIEFPIEEFSAAGAPDSCEKHC